MKSLLKPVLIFLFVVLGFTACRGPQGPQGPPGANGWAYFDVKYYSITRWALASNGTYFFSEVDNPAITFNVLDKGVVVGYIVYDYNTPNEVHVPLPFDIYFNDNGVQWTETVSFEVTKGRITFYYEPDDFNTVATKPPACMFKIVAMW